MKFEVWAVFLNERLTRVDQWLWAVQSKAMNYRHAFHAGNHGDVLKHVVLTRVLSYMTEKDSPLAVLDAHAGIGHYDSRGLKRSKRVNGAVALGRFYRMCRRALKVNCSNRI